MKYTALIVAAGSGSRMGLGYNKLLYTLDNKKTIIENTIMIFANDKRCQQLIVVTSHDDLEGFKVLLKNYPIEFVEGGESRQESVYQGLAKTKEEYVLIHDGARPWLSMECIDRILDQLSICKACLLMVPLKDTIKEVKDGKVIQTYVRSTLAQAQTPQAFDTELIQSSYQKAMDMGIQATDDAQIIELCSEEDVYVVEGSYENLKVTTIEDIKK